MSKDTTLYAGIVVALVLGAVVGYFMYPSKPTQSAQQTQTQTVPNDIEQKISSIQWKNNGTFFMSLSSLCLGVWNYFRGYDERR